MPNNQTGNDRMTALIVPGIGNSGPGHWQTLWERQEPDWRRVQQRDWDRPVCEEWVRELDGAITALAAPVLLIAHSMGCLVVAQWASRSRVPVRAAFLVAVPDPSGPCFPPTAQGFQPLFTGPLPFPSLVVASRDDPFGSAAFARRCAAQWGSDFLDIGAVGHVNADSGLGAWPAGRTLLDEWLKSLRQ